MIPIPTGFHYKTEPRGKQREVIESTWHEPRWAFLCRPGTGKTKLAIDTAAMLYMTGKISAMIVVTLNNVHRQWIEEGLPAHLTDAVPYTGGVYDSGMGKRASTALHKKLTTRDMGLRVLGITYEGLQTKAGREFAHALAVSHKSLLVVDESHRVSNIRSAGWKAVHALAALCPYRRLSTGTLFRQNPFSAYGQFELLGMALLGFASLSSFKSMYSDLLPPENGLVRKIARDFAAKTGRKITPQIQAKDENGQPRYKNLPHLRKRLEAYSSFLTLADVQGTEPEVRLSVRYVNPTPEQAAMYQSLQDVGVVELGDKLLTSELAITTGTRLSQIVGGFVPSDDDPNARPIPGGNPKLDALMEYLEELGSDEKVVIWCRFTAEIEAVMSILCHMYGVEAAVKYNGELGPREKAANKRYFMNEPRCRYFVGHIAAGGTGLDGLQAVASYMVFYSNGYSYTDRDQAVARLARVAGSLVVNVTDIQMAGTVDDDVVRCMQTAQDVHTQVLHKHVAPRRLV